MRLSDFLSHFSDVRSERDGWVVPCPAHADSNPSMRVALNEDNDLLLHCRAGCTKASVLDALENKGITKSSLFKVTVDDSTAVPTRSTTANVGPTPAQVAVLRMYVQECSQRFAETDAERYAYERFGLDRDQAVALNLGFDPGGSASSLPWRGKPYARVPRLVVPFADANGIVRALQGRDLTGTDAVRWCGLTNPEDSTWAKYGFFNSGSGNDFVLITEGPGDALTAVGAGFDAIAIRGAALGSVIKELTGALAGRTVVVAGDNDTAGQSFNAAATAVLAGAGVTVVPLALPQGINDLSDWRKANPAGFPGALMGAIRSASSGAGAPPPSAPVAVVPDEPTYNHTELGNALRLRDRFNGDLRWTPEAGFMLFNGVTWEADRFDSVRTAAQDMLLIMEREAAADYEVARMSGDAAAEEAAKLLTAWMKRSQTSRAIDALIKELRALAGVACSLEDFDSHTHLLAFKNTVVDLRDGSMVPANRDLLITRQLRVDYDPTAQCPRWLAFLNEVFPNHPEMPDYLRRLVGYGITGRTDEQCFVVLHGTGANGKSVFTETLSDVFKAITNTTPFSTFEEKPNGGIPNDLAALKGARMVMASEGEAGRPMAEAMLKRITGRDMITARFMRQEFFSYRPTFLLMLGTNHKPQFRGQDEGLWRRVKLIPWERYFSPDERNHHIWQELLEEAEGICAWAVQGAVEWFASGLGDPKSVVNATANYRANADALAGFFPGVLEHDPNSSVVGANAFQAYVEWCEEEHLPLKERWTRRAFYAALEERGVQRRKTEKGQTLIGVRLVDQKSPALNPLRAV